MIVVYCLAASICGYLTAIGGLNFLRTWLQLLFQPLQSRKVLKTPPSQNPHHTSEKERSPKDTSATAAEPEQPVSKESTQEAKALIPAVPRPRRKRVIVAMTGATGAVLGIRLLEQLRRLDVETHLVMSKWAEATIAYETDVKIRQVRALASKVYSIRDVAAPISSGSFHADGMFVVPCSMKTLSAIANGYGDDLISRACDVTLKERRRLIVVARETPLTGIHLENMLKVTQNGGIIFPPVPAFYVRPKSVDDVVNQSVGRMLDLIGLDTGDFERWGGMRKSSDHDES